MDLDSNNDELKIENENELKKCLLLLNEFISKPSCDIFIDPVNTNDYPEYKKIIKNPMSLQEILNKFNNNKYNNSYEFAYDMRLIWLNAKTFNTPGSGIYVLSDKLSKTFERNFSKIVNGYMFNPNKNNKNKYDHLKLRNKPESTLNERKEFIKLFKQLNSFDIGQIVELIENKCPLALINDNNNHNQLSIQTYHIPKDIIIKLIEIMNKKINH